MRLDLFDDAGNLIFVAAYLVKDILWLRILSIAGSLVVIPFYLLQPEPLWTPTFWVLVFIGINCFRAWQIFHERRPASLSPDEQALYQQGFNSLSSQQFGKMSAAGKWRDIEVGQRIQAIDDFARVTALASGKLEVSRNGKMLGSFGPGDLLGISSVLENRDVFHEALDTRVVSPVRVLQWDASDLKRLADADPEFDSALSKLAASSLATRLVRFLQLE